MSAKEFNHKEHKEHKETIVVTLAAEASKNLLNVESRSVLLVRGRLRPPKKKPPRCFPKTQPKTLLDRGRKSATETMSAENCWELLGRFWELLGRIPQQKNNPPYLV
ncbi:MAG: hypothetical protein IKX40_07015 [Thermoguttaceae bacterium]|nr:hypothetical protein [Thermoguttaceae bacterium]